MRRLTHAFLLPALCLAVLALTPAAAGASLLGGPGSFSAMPTADGGVEADTVAGSHPFSVVTELNLAEPGLRDLELNLPAGLIENPSVVAQCTQATFHSTTACPLKSQIGTIALSEGGKETAYVLSNLVPPSGTPSQFGFRVGESAIVLSPHIRETASEYGLTVELADFPQQLEVEGLRLVLWGTPWSVAHDGQRGPCLNPQDPGDPLHKCSVGALRENPRRAYLTLPANCAGPLVFGVSVSGWGSDAMESATASDPPLTACDTLRFEPQAATRLNTGRAGSPSGLQFEIEGDEAGLLEPARRVSSQVKKAVIALPSGVTLNPSLGAGLGVCTAAQFAVEALDAPPGAGCPNVSKIGTLILHSPLFEGEIRGGMFLAQPDDPEVPGHENPFDSLLALYLIAKSPQRGVMVRLAGKVDADPVTGQLVATFDRLPQLPYSNFSVEFSDGQRTAIATPATCGRYESRATLSPWFEPAATRVDISPFVIDSGVAGGPCPSGTPPFAPGAVSGDLNRSAGTATPYYLHLTRTDAEQEITSYSAELPPGLLGKLRGIPFCPDASIAAAAAKTGFGELRQPSCPASSSIGHTVSGYGLGSVLAYAPGGLYLAGPYHGAPLSIVAIDSATVGPFDLGVIVIRSAIRIDPRTARVSIDSAGSDPIPHIVKGIPLHLRDIRVYIDRPGFTVNPTSCENFGSTSTIDGSGASFGSDADDTLASVTSHFQVSNCSALRFEPRMSFRLSHGVKRGDFPRFTATVRPSRANANIAKAAVTLPAGIFLAQEHIETICTQPQFVAQHCPPDSVYGSARAYSPLLGRPLEGPVFLRASNGSLPDIVADLSAGGIRIEVPGQIDHEGSQMRATFEGLPDAPVSSFTMTLAGGKRGLLVNSEDLCGAHLRANARMAGQNNGSEALHPKVLVDCGKKSRGGGGARR